MELKVPEINNPKESEIDDLITRVKIARAKIEEGPSQWKKVEDNGSLEKYDPEKGLEDAVRPVIIRAEVERRKREKKAGADDELAKKYKTVVEKATEGENAWLSAELVNREADSYMGIEEKGAEDGKEVEEKILAKAQVLAGDVMSVVAAMSVKEVDMASLVTRLLGLRRELELLVFESKKTWQELAREAGVSSAGIGAMEAANVQRFDLFGDAGKQPVAMAA